MLQCYNNAARSNLGQGYWEIRRVGGTHIRDTGGKTYKSVAPLPAANFPPVFAPRVTDQNKIYIGANLCSITCSISACAFPAPYKIPRGGRRRPETGVLLKCSQNMCAGSGNF